MSNQQSENSPRENDGLLVEKIKQRDENALSLLYDRYAVLIFSLLMRMLRSVEDAENLFQEVFTHLWNYPEQYDVKSGSLLIPLTARARNRSLTRIRTRGVKKQNLQHDTPIPPLYSDSASLNELSGLETPMSPAQVLDALRKLSGDEQRMLSLAYYDGHSLWDISRRLNLPAGTVSWALWKSLSDMRKSLGIEIPSAPNHEKKLFESCTAHVLDALDAQETIEFNKHYAAGCEICKTEIARLKEITALIPFGLPHISLSPELKQRVLFAARLSDVMKVTSNEPGDTTKSTEDLRLSGEDSAGKKPGRRNPMVILVMILLSIALIVSIVHTVYLQRRINQQIRPFDQPQLIERLSEAVEYKNDVLEILASKNLTIIPFTPYQNNQQSEGKLFWNPEDTSAVIQIAHLPTTPDDQRYQLWAFAKGSYYLCGIFSVRRQLNSENFFPVRIPLGIQTIRPVKFFVSLEKAGPSEVPLGPRYLSGGLTERER